MIRPFKVWQSNIQQSNMENRRGWRNSNHIESCSSWLRQTPEGGHISSQAVRPFSLSIIRIVTTVKISWRMAPLDTFQAGRLQKGNMCTTSTIVKIPQVENCYEPHLLPHVFDEPQHSRDMTDRLRWPAFYAGPLDWAILWRKENPAWLLRISCQDP